MNQSYRVRLLPDGPVISAREGENLYKVLQQAKAVPDAPCGGHGTCKKCRVWILEPDGTKRECLACQTRITSDLNIDMGDISQRPQILAKGCSSFVKMDPAADCKYLAAFDIGTTTVVCYLLDGRNGQELAAASMQNPQWIYGADVVSRIQYAMQGGLEKECSIIREGMTELIWQVCRERNASPEEIGVVSVVGNPCMQQLFMGIDPKNLGKIPFSPVLTKSRIEEAGGFLPVCSHAKLLVIPDISGYVGADTLACILATQMYRDVSTLLVDIGTNGEMVLIKNGRMAACATAAGPALEGARIKFGMRGASGAIDHVWMENGKLRYSTIGGEAAKGICGSGLIDVAAVMAQYGIINQRGRLKRGEEVPEFSAYLQEEDGMRLFRLTEEIYLTQEDIRELQLAKGAIAAGITLLAEHLGSETGEIDRILLAGAFGSYMRPESACRIGLLPKELCSRIQVVGNAAGSGSKILACSKEQMELTNQLLERIEFLELASLPGFQKCFAQNMRF